jgi:hypothetical protein
VYAGCVGHIARHKVENCSCHISPPCGACIETLNFCPVCQWEQADDHIINDFVVQIDRETGVYKSWEPRPLDKAKIDWRSKSHTNASMIKEGVFPPGTSVAEVRTKVDGTFGGRFDRWDEKAGEFRFIAYTD